jgi:hypothetical protein
LFVHFPTRNLSRYVDDTLFYSPKEEYIQAIIEQLKQEEMDLEVEGEVAGFLGVHIQRDNTNNTTTLTQQGLINRLNKLQHRRIP